MTISSDPSAGIDDIEIDERTKDTVYDLNGNLITSRPLSPELYIINGKKILIEK